MLILSSMVKFEQKKPIFSRTFNAQKQLNMIVISITEPIVAFLPRHERWSSLTYSNLLSWITRKAYISIDRIKSKGYFIITLTPSLHLRVRHYFDSARLHAQIQLIEKY